MSLAQRRTKLVLSVIESLVAEGLAEFRPGHIATRLREQNQPMGTWEVRGELSSLEAEGLIEIDADTGCWRLVPEQARKAG